MAPEKLDGPAQALADEIVSRLACNELPADIAKWIRKEFASGAYGSQYLGYGPFPVTMEYRFNPDGSIWLQLGDTNAQPFWHTTLRPPAL